MFYCDICIHESHYMWGETSPATQSTAADTWPPFSYYSSYLSPGKEGQWVYS